MTKTRNSFSAVSDNFALDLLKLEQDANPGKNVVLSPVTVLLALGTTMNGHRGKGRQATATALGFGNGRSLRGINQSIGNLRTALAETTEVDLDVANSLYGPTGLVFKQHFLDKSQQFFDARIRLLDFKDPSSVIVMNSFICQKTKGKIPAILDEIENADAGRIIVLNAAYFRGFWTTGFDPLLTQPEQFNHLDGSKSDCALMYREGCFSYQGNLKFQAVKLPYGASQRFAMYIFLPLADREFGMQALLGALADDGLTDCFRHFAPCNGKLYLPRFKVEYASTLNESLKQLGVAEACDDAPADLSSMATGGSGTKITIKHKTVVEVDEVAAPRSAKASQASQEKPSQEIRTPGMIMAPSSFTLQANRSFCFFVRDEKTGSLCIAGIMNDPALNTSAAVKSPNSR